MKSIAKGFILIMATISAIWSVGCLLKVGIFGFAVLVYGASTDLSPLVITIFLTSYTLGSIVFGAASYGLVSWYKRLGE